MRSRKFLAGALRLSAAIALTVACAAGAGGRNQARASSSTSYTVTVTGGGLSVTTPSSVSGSGVTLNGTLITSTATVPNISLIDARGTGAGWTLSVQAADLITGSYTIPFSDLQAVAASPVISDTSSTSASGLSVGAGGLLSGTDTTPGTTLSNQLTLLTAPANQGMGSYTDTVNLAVGVPANTWAGGTGVTATYATNLIFAVQ